MKGITVEKVGAELQVSDLSVPEPADDQILVKSIYAAVNPVDALMLNAGFLVLDWPWSPGCDAGGVVVKAGSQATSPLGKPFKEGDRVIGCTRLGSRGYSAFTEYFLMDAQVTLPLPGNLTLAEGCTLGVATYTAILGIFKELKISIPEPATTTSSLEEWVLVFGGASSVGKAAIQILKALGYKVIATGSSKSVDLVKSVGADEVVDYKRPAADIIKEVAAKTGGKVFKAFDATGQDSATALPLFKATADGEKRFTSTNDWTPIETEGVFEFNAISLGPVGRADSKDLNKSIHNAIPFIYHLIETKKITPAEYDQVGETGIKSPIEAYAYQVAGKGGSKKVIAKIAES